MDKHPGGRPVDYKPEYCAIAIEVLSEKGAGREQVAARLDTTLQTIRNWRKRYREFDYAMTVGLNRSKAELLNHAVKHIISTKTKMFNTPVFNKILQTVFRDDDTAAVEIDGWNDAKTIPAKFDLIVSALGNGDITAEQADKFSNVLTKHIQATKIDEIETRIKALEAK